MKDANVEFEKGGRQDLVDEEKAKIVLMEEYLPKQMSDEELAQIVKEVVSSATDKNFGMIMKSVMAKVQGKADGGRVSAMVKQSLQ